LETTTFSIVSFCVADKCDVGEEPNPTNTGCVSCQLGYYQNVPESIECMQCAVGYSTRNTASNSSADCESMSHLYF